MKIGALDRRALIESPTAGRDAYGATVPGWTSVATVWAQLKPMGGGERLAVGAQVSDSLYSVYIRYNAALGLTEGFRVTIEGKTMVVRNIAEVGRREGYKIDCEVIK